MDAVDEGLPAIRLLCSKKSLLSPPSSGIRWLVGSPLFLAPLTVTATLRCLHALPGDPFSPDLPKEAEDIQALLLRGFDIVGALFVGSTNCEEDASKALEVSWILRKYLFGERGSHNMIGASANTLTGDIHFLVSKSNGTKVAESSNVIYQDYPESYLWEKGCLLRCELPLKFPVYVPLNERPDIEARFSSLIESTTAELRDPRVAYLVEGPTICPDESPRSIILHGNELNFGSQVPAHLPHKTGAKVSNANILACSHFCSTKRYNLSSTTRESADAIRITVLSNQSVNSSKSGAPVVEYFPASAPASLSVICLKLDVLCYTSIDFPVVAAVSELVVPGLVDQLNIMKKAIVPELLTQQLQLCPYHFLPPGFLIPITTIYDIRYGEIEEKQGELRKSLHLRLGLPLNRPLLRISNALTFSSKGRREKSSTSDGSSLLRDVHTEIPSSSVSGGIISLIDGSYEYYHYLHDGIDDNGWGCAYRSLQTIISWYRLQQYTSINVPSHRFENFKKGCYPRIYFCSFPEYIGHIDQFCTLSLWQ